MSILPHGNYRNPASVIEEERSRPIKLAYGCTACEFNKVRKYDSLNCMAGQAPGYGGYCPKWSLDEGWNGVMVN